MELELQCSSSVQGFLCAQQACWLPLSSGHGESFFHVLTMWVLDRCNNSLEELPLLNCIAPTPLQSCFAESLWLYLFWQVLWCLLSSNAYTSAKEYGFFSVHLSQDAHIVFSSSLELAELYHMATVYSLHVQFFVLFLFRNEEILTIRLGLRWCSVML